VDLFDALTSSTYVDLHEDFLIEYMDGDTVTGTQGLETLTLSPLTNSPSLARHISSQPFALVSSLSFSITCSEDGILGLSFQDVSVNGKLTPLQTMHAQGVIQDMAFGFYLSGDSTFTKNEDGAVGEVTFGGYDPDHYIPPLTFVDVAKRTLSEMYPTSDLSGYSEDQLSELHYSGYWDFDVDGVVLTAVNPTTHGDAHGDVKTTTDLLTTTSGAVADTGTSLIYGPLATVMSLYRALGGKCYYVDTTIPEDDQLYVMLPCDANAVSDEYSLELVLVDCGTKLDMVFSIGGDDFSLTERDILARDTTLEGDDWETKANDFCEDDQFIDCAGTCISNEQLYWKGDDECDSGAYGFFLNCPRFNCDDDDCDSRSCFGNEVCWVTVYPNDFGDNSWLLGDVFMRRVYVAHDYENRKMGFAYSRPLGEAKGDGGEEESTNAPSPVEESFTASPSASPTTTPLAATMSPTFNTSVDNNLVAPRQAPVELKAMLGVGLLLVIFCAFFALKKFKGGRGGPIESTFERLEDLDDVVVGEGDFTIDDDDDDEEEFMSEFGGGGGGGGSGAVAVVDEGTGAEMVQIRSADREANI
jgi:hypothetical protein